MTDETLIALAQGVVKKPQTRLPELRVFYARLIEHLKKEGM